MILVSSPSCHWVVISDYICHKMSCLLWGFFFFIPSFVLMPALYSISMLSFTFVSKFCQNVTWMWKNLLAVKYSPALSALVLDSVDPSKTQRSDSQRPLSCPVDVYFAKKSVYRYTEIVFSVHRLCVSTTFRHRRKSCLYHRHQYI